MTQALSEDRQAIARALAYPYHRPPSSFLFSGGVAVPLTADHAASWLTNEREKLVPVLAVGSNAAPEQLNRKFGSSAQVRIPVTLGSLSGADIVYCAYMTGYGSVPATLIESPGVCVSVGITWLNAQQLAQMHQTEAVGSNTDYGWVSLDGFELSPSLGLPGGGLPTGLFTYRSRLGLLGINNAPVSLAELPATGRHSLALSQQQLQRRVRRWTEYKILCDRPSLLTDFSLNVMADFPQWVRRNVGDEGRRMLVSSVLQARRIERDMLGFKIASTA